MPSGPLKVVAHLCSPAPLLRHSEFAAFTMERPPTPKPPQKKTMTSVHRTGGQEKKKKKKKKKNLRATKL